jgi:hypothetical protein
MVWGIVDLPLSLPLLLALAVIPGRCDSIEPGISIDLKQPLDSGSGRFAGCPE